MFFFVFSLLPICLLSPHCFYKTYVWNKSSESSSSSRFSHCLKWIVDVCQKGCWEGILRACVEHVKLSEENMADQRDLSMRSDCNGDLERACLYRTTNTRHCECFVFHHVTPCVCFFLSMKHKSIWNRKYTEYVICTWCQLGVKDALAHSCVSTIFKYLLSSAFKHFKSEKAEIHAKLHFCAYVLKKSLHLHLEHYSDGIILRYKMELRYKGVCLPCSFYTPSYNHPCSSLCSFLKI